MNGTFGFSTTGIHPYNPQAVPQQTFAISNGSRNDAAVVSTNGSCDMFPPPELVAVDYHHSLLPPAPNTGYPV